MQWPFSSSFVAACRAEAANTSPPGRCCGDILTLEDDTHEGRALIQSVLRRGRRVAVAPSLQQIRRYAHEQLQRLPASLTALEPSGVGYPVEIAESVLELAAQADRLHR